MVAKRFYKSLRYEETKTDQDWVEAAQLFDDVNLQPNISSPINGQNLSYDALTNRWINKTVTIEPPIFTFTWIIYKAGTLYKAKGSNGQTYEGENLKTNIFDNIRFNPATKTRIHFLNAPTTYDWPTGSTLETGGNDFHISGESIWGVVLRPLGNSQMISCTNKLRQTFENFTILVDQGDAYTADALRITNSSFSGQMYLLRNLRFQHWNPTFTQRSQNGRAIVIVLAGTNPAQSWITAENIIVDGFNSVIEVTTSGASGFAWANENAFTRLMSFHSKYFCRVNIPAVGTNMAYGWYFRDCSWQTTGVSNPDGTADMFDLDITNCIERGWNLDNCIMWDPPDTTKKFLKANTNCQVLINGGFTITDDYMGGSGWDAINGRWNPGAHVERISPIAIRRGVEMQSGNGTQTVFNIPHRLFKTPKLFDAKPRSTDAKTLSDYTQTANATNIVLTYAVAPITGTNNLTWQWEAREFV